MEYPQLQARDGGDNVYSTTTDTENFTKVTCNSTQQQQPCTSSNSATKFHKLQHEESTQTKCTPVSLKCADLKGNPLFIPEIMILVGQFLQKHPKTIASARITCKFWATILKQFQTLKLNEIHHQNRTPNFKDFLHCCSSNPTSTGTEEEEEEASASAVVPVQFSKYHLNGVSFNNPSIPTLFKSLGTNMKSLKITINKWNDLTSQQFRDNIYGLAAQNLRRLIVIDERCGYGWPARPPPYPQGLSSVADYDTPKFWNETELFNTSTTTTTTNVTALPQLPKLQILVLSLDSTRVSHVVLSQLLNTAPNLAVLSFTNNSCHDTAGMEAILDALTHKTNIDKLQSLKFNYPTAVDLNSLIGLSERVENRLVLKSLNFHLNQLSLNDSLNQLLQLQAHSLQSLKIELEYRCRGGSLTFPQMPVLEDLELELCCIGHNIDLVSQLPNLKKLVFFNYHNEGDNQEIVMRSWLKVMSRPDPYFSNPYMSVQELNINYIVDAQQLYRLSELFPALTKLFVGLEYANLIQGLRSINKWPKLESLCIVQRWWHLRNLEREQQEQDLIDEYITGIPTGYHSTCLLDNLETWKQFKAKPGISDLKCYLTHLELVFDAYVSDVSVYFGILQPNSLLRTLIIAGGEKISSAARLAIRDNSGPLSYITYGDDDDGDSA